MAALAEQERRLISERTKRALAALKARGATLGTPANLTDTHRALGSQRRRSAAKAHPVNRQATALIVHLRQAGLSYRQIAHRLNAGGFASHRGRGFCHSQVRRLWLRKDQSIRFHPPSVLPSRCQMPE